MPRPVTQADLLQRGCAVPGCTHDHSVLYPRARCHTRGLDAEYSKEHGTLTLTCYECNSLVVVFQIAAGPEDPAAGDGKPN